MNLHRHEEEAAAADRWFGALVAAGRGERMQSDRPKGRIPVSGEPLFLHSLRVLVAHPGAERIFLMVQPDGAEIALARKLVDSALDPAEAHRVRVCAGGEERQDSVFAALQAMREEGIEYDQTILIHDAARPLLTGGLIARCLDAMRMIVPREGQGVLPGLSREGPWGGRPTAVVPGLPVRDTLKLVFENRIVLTQSRENLYSIQTPQVFRFGPLMEAHLRAQEGAVKATDDATLLEWQGIPVYVVPGEITNWKVTFPSDVLMAEKLLRSGGAR
jgi:2-C-methyl-D-erythritol 4-phosphate cytidylyltransferase